MKLIVQIPCFNEEGTLATTIKDIPRKIDGVDEVEILVIDDGCTDCTIDVARYEGVDHIVRFIKNKGLARAFNAGLEASIKLGADIIVNTDADNQYKGSEIPKLIRPILEKQADIVVGSRQIDDIEHFSSIKKMLQKMGSWVVRRLSDTEIEDTTSGFRAYSREAALKLNIVSPYTYTLESIIQAGKKFITITDVPISVNKPLRKSKLFRSIPSYISRQAITIIRMYTMFQPLRVFFFAGFINFLLGSFGICRFLYYYATGSGDGHIQSLVLASSLLVLSFILFMMGLLSDIISFNRRLIEEVVYKIRKIDTEVNNKEKIDFTI